MYTCAYMQLHVWPLIHVFIFMHLTVIILSFVLLFFYSSSGLFTATVTAVFTKTGRAGFNIFQAL